MRAVSRAKGKSPNPILCVTEAGKSICSFAPEGTYYVKKNCAHYSLLPIMLWQRGLERRRDLRGTAPCHKAVCFSELTLGNGRLIFPTSVIQKPEFLESAVCLSLPISIPQNLLENMETKHTWPQCLATSLPIPWHETGWPWGFKEVVWTHRVAGHAPCSPFLCSFKSQQLQ